MSDLADLFKGFESHWVDSPQGRIFARSHGAGSPVILLHGFPQTHVLWHKIAPALAKNHKVIAFDLRGYGWSSAPRPDSADRIYSKRGMGEDILAVLDHFGLVQAALVGHDRGGRVAYRFALDHPGRVTKLAVVDIVPTYAMWDLIEMPGATVARHWLSLARPAAEAEAEVKKNPQGLIATTMASWTATGDLKAFDARALAHYRAFVQDPSRIAAMCADYRAGLLTDRPDDLADIKAGKRIAAPVLSVWGQTGIPSASADPLALWKSFAPQAKGQAIKGGHFLPEENPTELLAALEPFLGSA